MRHNGDRRPEEILAEIDRTRGEMDRTLNAIEQRLTPGQLVDQGLDYLRHSGATEFAQNLGGAAKQNPLPVALATIGIGWLMALGRQPAQHEGYGSNWTSDSSSHSSSGTGSGMRESMSSVKDRASGAMHSASEGVSSAKHKIGDTMSSVRERATGAAHSASEGMASAKQRLGSTMSSVADTTRQQYQRARGGIDYLVNEQPLLLGAIGLAIGAALGAAAPRTRKEEEMMGEASRNLMDKAKETGSEQLEKAKEIGTQQVEKAKEAMKQTTSPQGQHSSRQDDKAHPSASHQFGQQQSSQQQGQRSSQHDGKAQQVKPQVTPTQAQQPRTQQTPTTPEKKGGW